MRSGILVALTLLFALSFAQNPSKRTGRTRGHAAGSSLSSSASRTACEGSDDEWRPSGRLDLNQTPRAPRPARQAATARSALQAQAPPSGTTVDNVIEISDSSEDQQTSAPVSVSQPNLPSANGSIAPPSQSGDGPDSRANSVVNPLDLDDPVYRAPTPDTPERMGRRYLLLNQPPPTPEFYEQGDAASNTTGILTTDRFLHRTLHPQFVFNRDERLQLFDRAVDQLAHTLRHLEFTTNADFFLTIGLPGDCAPDDGRLSRVIRSRTIDSSDYYGKISDGLTNEFRSQITDTRRAEVQEWLEFAQWEADQREAARVLALERAEREIREQEQALAAAAAAAAERQAAVAAERRAAVAAERRERATAAHDKPAEVEDDVQRTNAKRPNTSPAKRSAPAKKRKDDDGVISTGAGRPAARRQPATAKPKVAESTGSSKGKGKQKAAELPSTSTSEGTGGTSAGANGTDHHDPDSSSQVQADTDTDADADADADADTEADDPDLRKALAASLKTVVTDEEKRLGQPVASSSNIQLDDVQPGQYNALAPRANQPHRPEPILPTAVTLYLMQITVPPEFWPAIELVWTTTTPVEYPDAIAGVSARCALRLTPADIYTLAALLSRTSPPRRS